MQVGVKLMDNPIDVDEIMGRAMLADRLGFDSVWLSDHMMWPKPVKPAHATVDTWTTMTAVGAITSHVRLGFSMLNPSFRPPAVLAKMVTTLDQITKGRVIFSLGAGSFPPEFPAYDLVWYGDHADRTAHEREVALVCKTLWTADAPVNFDGRFVHLEDCYFYPPAHQQPHPPIWFGGNSEHTRALVRELGDGWVMQLHGVERCVAALRSDPAWPERPITLVSTAKCAVADTRAEAARKLQGFVLASLTTDVDTLIAEAVAGTVDDCIARLAQLEALGLDHIFLAFDSDESLEWFAREALPRVPARPQPVPAV
jgi:alkanesulfonate monooxygenase SsuD/methylene tetrahydromethanopterin reductase-like flavin-dependent oxidoreductase (luciferase family)